MKKRNLIGILLLTSVLSLTSCGVSNDPSESEVESITESESYDDSETYTVKVTVNNTTVLESSALSEDVYQGYDMLDESNTSVGEMYLLWEAGAYRQVRRDTLALGVGTSVTPYDSTYVKTITISYLQEEVFTVYSNDSEVTGELIETSTGGGTTYTYTVNSSSWSITNTSSEVQGFYNFTFGVRYQDVYPESLTLNPTNMTVGVGETASFTVSYLPINTNQKDLVVTSSDESVATVSGKEVTGVSVGNTTITVTGGGSNPAVSTIEVSVIEIPVSGVTLNQSSITVSLETSKTLEATVSPSNATNKNVIWSSADSTIATVSSSGVVSGVSVGNTTVTVTTEDGGYTASCEVKVKESSDADWTIMIYMSGNDLESSYTSGTYSYETGLATADIMEIVSVENQPDTVNIIIETGGASSWESNFGVKSNKLGRWHVENNQLVEDAQLDNANMGAVSTFQSFLEWGLTEYPAERTMVILWNHGGAMQGVCYDENYNDNTLLNSEIQEALEGAFTSVGRSEKLECIGYDACLMDIQDIAETNSHYFNYMVASEESENGYGWDYDGGWLDMIYADPSGVNTESVLTECCDNFIADNEAIYPTYNDQTLAWLKLSKAEAYMTAWENMARYMIDESIVTSSNRTSFANMVRNNVKHYGDTTYTYYGTFDAYDFLNNLEASETFNTGEMQSYIDNCQNAFNDLIGYFAKGDEAGNSYGLCMFYSISSNCQKMYYYTTSETNFTNWVEFNNKFGY